MKIPLFPFLIAMIAGILTGNFFAIQNQYIIFFLFFLFLLLLVARFKTWKNLSILLLALSFFFIGICNIRLYLHKEQSPDHIINYLSTDDEIVAEGIISENPEISPDKADIIVSLTRMIREEFTTPVRGSVLLSVKDCRFLKYGDYVRFRSRLKQPHNFNNPGTFDYVKQLQYRGIMVRGTINNPSNILVMRENQGSRVKIYFEKYREKLRKIIRENSLNPEGQIIQAMILGDQKEIPKEVMEKFNQTGTTHIIAISGFNIGIIAALSFIVVRMIMKSSTYLLLKFNMNVVATVFSIIPVIFYTFVAGLGISVVRAAIMAVTLMIAIVVGKEKDLYNTLAIAAFIILVISPYALFDISFQLSFVAVWSILYITPRLLNYMPAINSKKESKQLIHYNTFIKDTVIFLSVTVSAILGTLPLILFYFNRLSPIALLANILVVPLLGVITIPFCIAITVAAMISVQLSILFIHISSFLVWVSLIMVDLLSSINGASIFISTPTLTEIILYYCLLIVGVMLLRKTSSSNKESIRKEYAIRNILRFSIAFVILLLLISNIIYLNTRDLFTKNMRITVIDVGQGSSILVQIPNGKRILIDGGGVPEGNFDIGKFVVAPFLWHNRISTIDLVVLSHLHPDHINGLIFILSNFRIKEVWTNSDVSKAESYEKLMKIIEEKNIIHRQVSDAFQSIKINNVIIDILNPEKQITTKAGSAVSRIYEDENNRSIVIKMTYGNIQFLFPGDISEFTERRLTRSDHNIRSQVLFVPHHGGFSSSTLPFLKRVLPQIAVISCGTGNIYKFPHPEVIKRYSNMGTKILRTDENGAITITTDGENIVSRVYRDDNV